MGLIVPDAVERYLSGLNRQVDGVLADIARDGETRKLPLVDAEVGALLQVLARAAGARRILEIGTAIGYSGIWLARALPPDGMLLTLEMNAERAREARANFERAGVADRTSVIVGDAMRFLHKVAGPFDLIFQDGDKALYTPMLDALVEHLRPGGVLVTDNVLWDGEVVEGFVPMPRHDAVSTAAIRTYNARLAAEERLLTTFLPMGDGVALSVRTVE